MPPSPLLSFLSPLLSPQERWTEKKWGGPKQYENPSGDLMMLPTDLALVQASPARGSEGAAKGGLLGVRGH